MAALQQHLQQTALLLISAPLLVNAQRFFPDDPLWKVPPPVALPAKGPAVLVGLYHVGKPGAAPTRDQLIAQGAINTLGEVPDNSWFTNRHARRRMSLDELRRGPGDANQPQLPLSVISIKTQATPAAFTFRDARGRIYNAEADPIDNFEMATAAHVIGSRFFYALGYNTLETYIVNFTRADLRIAEEATVASIGTRQRGMTDSDISVLLHHMPRRRDGSFRVSATMLPPGQPIGPFSFEGARPDDPNDITPHEHRRDLRGLFALYAWLNHTESRSRNTLDTVVEEGGRRFVKHFLIDFTSLLGSDVMTTKDARSGFEYSLPNRAVMLRRMVKFGIYAERSERAHYGKNPAVGRFEAAVFDPEEWVPDYPNPAFEKRTPEDDFWAAKLVRAFHDDDIRAIVETGQYSNPESTKFVTNILIARRDKVVSHFLQRVLPLDEFRVQDNALHFTNLSGTHDGFEISWSTFDNASAKLEPVANTSGPRLPLAAPYLAARITTKRQPAKSVTIFIRNNRDIVGIERN